MVKQSLTLDSLDRRIVAELQQDAALSNAELAERVGSTAPSCWRRVRALEQAGVLGRAVRLTDAQALGWPVTILCHVRMRDYDLAHVAAFEAFVDAQQRIMECYSVSGDWDYLMRVVAADVSDYEAFLMRELLRHPSVAGASSLFALSTKKAKTALPV